MSDAFVEELLKQWGVSQLVEHCRDQEVDVEALRVLREDMIPELVPRIGPRSKFLSGWRRWKLLGSPSPKPSTPVPAQPAQPAQPAFSPSPAASTGPSSPMDPVTPPPPPPHRGVTQVPHPKPAPSTQPQVELPTQQDDASVAKKEVNVYLEGKITYEESAGSGWLVADGFISRKHLDHHGRTIKLEPTAQQVSAEEFHMEPVEHKEPRFQLQGRISMSTQDFVEMPSFMLPEAGDGSSLPPDPTEVHEDSEVPSLPDLAGSRPSPSPSSSTPARAKRGRCEKFDLESILNTSSKGKMVLSLYRQRGGLDGQARQTLTDLVIAEELREDLNRRITSQRFQEIAEAIVELFPGENEDTYFSNDRSFGDRPGGKGKLTSKYYNTRRQLAKSGVISRGHNKEKRQMIQQASLVALQSSCEEDNAAIHNSKWLQSMGWQMDLSPDEMKVALDRWRSCWKLRMLRVLSPAHQPTMYLDEYPILRTPFSEKLINADFDMLFKTAGNRLMNDWPNFSQNIISMLSEDYRKQLPLLDHVKRNLTSAVGKQVGALLLLPSMLPVTTCKGAGDNGELWRPTRQEAQDGFLVQVEQEVEVTSVLERHWARMRLMGQPVCPLPVVVGTSLDHLETAIVAIDESTVLYVPNALCAVDMCFKCFHALQVPYPPQAQNVWLFLQHALYQLATPTDRMSVAVSSLLADFGYRPVPPVGSWDQVLLS